MEVILWLADDPNNLPIDPTFKTVGDLEATLRDRLLSQDDLLRSLALSEQIFYTDPDLPDDRDRAIQYSMGYALGAAKLKSKHPSLAYYRLTQLIRDLNKFPNIVSSTEYLRVQAEWIASAAYSSDFSSVYENRLRMETLLTMHIDRLT